MKTYQWLVALLMTAGVVCGQSYSPRGVSQTALDGKQTTTWLEADPTIFYDDFERADTVDGTLTPAPSGQTYTTTGSGAANGRIVDGKLTAVSPFGIQYHYPDISFVPDVVGVRFSYVAGSGTNAPDRGVGALLMTPNFPAATPMVHFYWDADMWWLETWDVGSVITPVVSGTFERRLKTDGTEYVFEIDFSKAAADTLSVRAPDGMVHSGTGAVISDLASNHIAYELINTSDPVYSVKFDAMWAYTGTSQQGPFREAIRVDSVRDNKSPSVVEFNRLLGSAAFLNAGVPINSGAPLGQGSVAVQAYRGNSVQQTATGANATAIGTSTAATGIQTTALGFGSDASGSYAVAVGADSASTSTETIAIGRNSTAAYVAAVAYGQSAKSTGQYTMAIGPASVASGQSSVAVGRNARAGYSPRAFTIADGGTTVTISGTNVTAEFGTVTNGTIITYTLNGITQSVVRTASTIAFSSNTTFTIDSALPAGVTSGLVSYQSRVSSSVALGHNAVVEGASLSGAVQIGSGTNSTSNTLQFQTNRVADTNGLAITGTNGISVTKAATGVTLGIEFSGTSAAPTNTATPAAWVDTVISGTVFKWPVYQ